MALRPALEDANSRKQNPVKEEKKCQVIGSLPTIKEIKPTTTDKTFSLQPTATQVTSNQSSAG